MLKYARMRIATTLIVRSRDRS